MTQQGCKVTATRTRACTIPFETRRLHIVVCIFVVFVPFTGFFGTTCKVPMASTVPTLGNAAFHYQFQQQMEPPIPHLLPAPHIWQLTPSLLDAPSSYSFNSAASPSSQWPNSSIGVPQSLVITVELHVRPDLADNDVLDLTKWAWERCVVHCIL